MHCLSVGRDLAHRHGAVSVVTQSLAYKTVVLTPAHLARGVPIDRGDTITVLQWTPGAP